MKELDEIKKNRGLDDKEETFSFRNKNLTNNYLKEKNTYNASKLFQETHIDTNNKNNANNTNITNIAQEDGINKIVQRSENLHIKTNKNSLISGDNAIDKVTKYKLTVFAIKA